MGSADDAVLLGVDVGGTFTDAVLADGGTLFRAKVLTTADQSEGVIAAASRALAAAGKAAAEVTGFAHGMTTATNALLERKGARTATVTNEGFRDLLKIGRQNRPRLYDLCPRRPEPLAPRELRFTVPGRLAPEGELEPLDEAAAAALADRLREAAPEAVAVCLLFSFQDPAHERRLKSAIEVRLPGVHVSLSSTVLPQFREYERLSTTVTDAYLTPVVKRYLEQLQRRAGSAGLPQPEIMQSSGGVVPLDDAAGSAAPLLFSGPAAGVTGAVYAARQSGEDELITFDMGGTSTDVALVSAGEVATAAGHEIGGLPVALPMMDIHTIGAGGGSIAWVDAGGALRVGPESAGSAPGPAAYGLGGERPTVTDANLCLGYLGERMGGDGGMALDAGAARRTVGRLAGQLGMSLEEVALSVRRVANAGMTRALRVISVERGHDPRRFALVAFGGAGPMHGADLAAEMGIGRVMLPDSCGVLSALGMVVGEERRDWVRTVYSPAGWDEAGLVKAFGRIEEELAGKLEGVKLTRRADLRYRGQSHELTVAIDLVDSRADITAAFAAAHEQAYGYQAGGEAVELVNIRLTASRARPAPALGPPAAATGESAVRQAWFESRWQEVPVWQRREMGEGRVDGPAIIEEDEATTVVPPGWQTLVDAAGNLWLEYGGKGGGDA